MIQNASFFIIGDEDGKTYGTWDCFGKLNGQKMLLVEFIFTNYLGVYQTTAEKKAINIKWCRKDIKKNHFLLSIIHIMSKLMVIKI